MEIWVTFAGGKFTITPDPARVRVGTPIVWRFLAHQSSPENIRWTVYFSNNSPFFFPTTEIITNTHSIDGQHTGATGAVAPQHPGEYKYGVRTENPQNQETMGDDDPQLVVTL